MTSSTNNIMTSSTLSVVSEESEINESTSQVWWSGLLGIADLAAVDTGRGSVLIKLQQIAASKAAIMADDLIGEEEKQKQVEELNMDGAKIEDLGLTFQYSPSSSLYGYESVDLKPGGEHEIVTIWNIEDYIEKILDWTLVRGIRSQLDSLRAGFCAVFPMEKLGSFSPSEVRTMLCGDQAPIFNKEEILKYTEPKLGYTKDSPGFLKFVNVLANMQGDERKAFLQFTTGCSSLPPGGLANLHPRLTVVRKVDAGDGSFPSVNTCVHYLKLPDYSSEEVLRERLLAATMEKGFHLN